jgi:PAS domain S-box-containing protein
MNVGEEIFSDADLFRNQAEERMRKNIVSNERNSGEADLLKLVHELEVHQVELEMQNIELQSAKLASDQAAKKYFSLFDFSPMALFILRPDRTILSVNSSGAKLIGKEIEGLFNTDFRLLVTPDTLPECNEFLQKVFESHAKQTCLVMIRQPDSLSPVFVQMEGVPGESPEEFLIAVIDVSRSILSEQKARRSEEKYRLLFEDMVYGAFYQLADGTLVDINKAALEMFGISLDQFLGRTSYHPDWKVIDENHQSLNPDQHPSVVALRTGSDVEQVIGVYNPLTKAYRWLRVNAKPQMLPGRHTPWQVFVTMHDITNLKRDEAINNARLHLVEYSINHSLDELLEETVNEAEKLTESKIGFFHFVDDDQVNLSLQSWSTATREQFCKAEGLGKHYPVSEAGIWADCIRERKPVIHNDYGSVPHRKGLPEDHAEVVREMVIPIFRGEKVVSVLGVGNKANDYNKDDINKASILANLAWDIALHKRAETALQASETRLIELNATKDKFFSIIAHDLRNPFNNILGFSELLKERAAELDAVTVDLYASVINASARQAYELLEHLLEWARMQEGKVPYSPQKVNLLQLVESELLGLRIPAMTKEIEIVHDIGEDLCAWGDENMLRSCLRNLITNAIKFTPKKGKVQVAVDGTLPGIHVQVIDSGIGMTREAIEKLFRIETSFTTRGTNNEHGAGLGLLLCKEFVEKHGGKIWVESKPGLGSQFHFTVPKAI